MAQYLDEEGLNALWAKVKQLGDDVSAAQTALQAAEAANTAAKAADTAASDANSAATAANSAATAANSAASKAETAAAAADKVNAVLDGTTVTITDREGTSKSVDLQEAITAGLGDIKSALVTINGEDA